MLIKSTNLVIFQTCKKTHLFSQICYPNTNTDKIYLLKLKVSCTNTDKIFMFYHRFYESNTDVRKYIFILFQFSQTLIECTSLVYTCIRFSNITLIKYTIFYFCFSSFYTGKINISDTNSKICYNVHV